MIILYAVLIIGHLLYKSAAVLDNFVKFIGRTGGRIMGYNNALGIIFIIALWPLITVCVLFAMIFIKLFDSMLNAETTCIGFSSQDDEDTYKHTYDSIMGFKQFFIKERQ